MNATLTISYWSLLAICAAPMLGLVMFGRLYLKASDRADKGALRVCELEGEAAALRRFIGCRGTCNRPSPDPSHG